MIKQQISGVPSDKAIWRPDCLVASNWPLLPSKSSGLNPKKSLQSYSREEHGVWHCQSWRSKKAKSWRIAKIASGCLRSFEACENLGEFSGKIDLNQDTLSGWWWLEPWNFSWLSMKIWEFHVPNWFSLHHFSGVGFNHQPVFAFGRIYSEFFTLPASSWRGQASLMSATLKNPTASGRVEVCECWFKSFLIFFSSPQVCFEGRSQHLGSLLFSDWLPI